MSRVRNFVLSIMYVILIPTYLSDSSLLFSNSYFSLLFLLGFYILFCYFEKMTFKLRIKKFAYPFGLLLSAMTAFGYSLKFNHGNIYFKSISLYICIVLYAYIFGIILIIFWTFLENMEGFFRANRYENKNIHQINKIIIFICEHSWIMFCGFLICWLPCYIAAFPGGYVYDAYREWAQLENGFNGNFPMLHSVLITKIISIGFELTGSYNTGIAFYTIVQMILISAMYVHILKTFYRKSINHILIGIMVLYCALFPVIQILVTQTVRDVLFSFLLTYTMFQFYLMTSEKEKFFVSIYKPIFLGIILVLTLLARNNNASTVALVVIIGISLFVFVKYYKKYLRGSLLFAGTTIIFYVLMSILLTISCQPKIDAAAGNSLSLFSQPLARAYLYENETWTNEEKEKLSSYMNVEGLTYVPENADRTKSRLKVDGKLKEFLIFWVRIGMKHPKCYVEAILENTQQMWFPASIIDGYKKAEISVYEPYEKCYYYYGDVLEAPGTHMLYFPRVREFYTNIGLNISFEKIPIISMFFSIGFQFWIVLNCVFYIGYRRCKHLYLPVAIVLGYTVISAFVPLILLRYFAMLFLAFPMTVVFTIQPSLIVENTEMTKMT